MASLYYFDLFITNRCAMNGKQTRLFVIIDPTSDHQAALLKALLIAKLGDCHIHAFVCVYSELKDHGVSLSRRDLKHQTLKETRAMVDELMEPCRQSNISFSTEVVWNVRWYDSVLHSIAKSGCDLVIKSSFHHSRARRFLSKTSDYSLMRYCACPMLFVHQAQEWNTDKILACVALESADSQHRRLNNAIIRDAIALKNITGMNLAIASVYQHDIDQSSLPISHDKSQSLVEALAEMYGVEEDNMILREGNSVESIKQVCEEIKPSILVIGSIAHTGLAGKLIGSTAEKLLDAIEPDLLVVN